MPLNIKNERVSKLAATLAAELGESITDAVGQAIEEKLRQLERHSSRRGLASRLMEIGRKCANEAPPGWLSRDFDSELYNEKGLPK